VFHLVSREACVWILSLNDAFIVIVYTALVYSKTEIRHFCVKS